MFLLEIIITLVLYNTKRTEIKKNVEKYVLRLKSTGGIMKK